MSEIAENLDSLHFVNEDDELSLDLSTLHHRPPLAHPQQSEILVYILSLPQVPMTLPAGLSPAYWSTWQPPRSGINVSEALEAGETWIGGWDNVGLYEGNNKVPDYQVISIHLTTHRLLIIPAPPVVPTSSNAPRTPSLQLHFSYARQTELYSGFMRSSPKITLSLGRPTGDNIGDSATANPEVRSSAEQSRTWTCDLCGFVNSLNSTELSASASSRCNLCGVNYGVSSRTSSLPTSRSSTPVQQTPASRHVQVSSPLNDGVRVFESTEGNSDTPKAGDAEGRIPCPACTFLNHPKLPFCEICSTALPSSRKRPTSAILSSPAPGSPTLENGNLSSNAAAKYDVVRLSFRKGGVQEAYRRLKNILSDKAWERQRLKRAVSKSTIGSPASDIPSGGVVEGLPPARSGAGIDHILQSMKLESKAQDEHMQDAFKDLEVLMVRAGEMVKLAQSLNAKLTAQQQSGSATVNEEEATLIRSTLVQLGLPAPALTADMVRDETKYHQGLAQELGHLLTGSKGSGQGLMTGKEGRGIIGLDEVWGLWMRARGVALLPPATLIAILPYIPSATSPPIHLLSLPSSLKVLHTPSFAPPAMLARLLSWLDPDKISANGQYETPENQLAAKDNSLSGAEESLSLIEISSYESIPIGLAKELMESIERLSPPEGLREVFGLVRDDQASGGSTRWYRDIISPWEL